MTIFRVSKNIYLYPLAGIPVRQSVLSPQPTRPGLCLYQAILSIYWCFCYWPFRDTVPHNSKNLTSEWISCVYKASVTTRLIPMNYVRLPSLFALRRQVTVVVKVFYILRKKFWSGNFRHLKFPMYTKGLTNRAPAKTLGESVRL